MLKFLQFMVQLSFLSNTAVQNLTVNLFKISTEKSFHQFLSSKDLLNEAVEVSVLNFMIREMFLVIIEQEDLLYEVF